MELPVNITNWVHKWIIWIIWFKQSINLLERRQSYLGMFGCQRHWQHDIYWGFTAGRSNGVNAKTYTSKMSAQIQPDSSKLMRWHFIIHTANVNTWWRGCIFLIDWIPKQPRADSDCCEWQGELHQGRGKPSADVCGSKSKSIFLQNIEYNNFDWLRVQLFFDLYIMYTIYIKEDAKAWHFNTARKYLFQSEHTSGVKYLDKTHTDRYGCLGQDSTARVAPLECKCLCEHWIKVLWLKSSTVQILISTSISIPKVLVTSRLPQSQIVCMEDPDSPAITYHLLPEL